MAEETETQTANPIQEQRAGKERMFQWLAFVLLIGANIILFLVYRTRDDGIPIGWIILTEFLVLIMALGLFFAFKIPEWISKRGTGRDIGTSLPILTREEAREMALAILKESSYMNEPRPGYIYDDGPEVHGKKTKQILYVLYCDGKFENTPGKREKYLICINMNFPKMLKKIKVNPSHAEIAVIKRSCVFDPEDMPDVEETETENVLTGTKTKTKKLKHKKDELKEEKGDLE